MVANQIMTNYQQNSHPQMVRNQQMVPNQPFVQQNMVHNKQMVPPNGHINQQVPMNHSQMQPVDPNQPRPVILNPEPAPNGPNNGPQVGCTYQQGQNSNQQQNNGRQIPSECKYQNGEIQKGDKNYCSCCYCEFFGNGAPVQAPPPQELHREQRPVKEEAQQETVQRAPVFKRKLLGAEQRSARHARSG